ncbi:MAG: DUF445 domain-containing protein [Actinobacteria bacterium]|nr:DUF445 domain-containing protein [Actinomycetota bacterium]
MKAVAGGLLLLAAAVFVISVTVGDDHGGWGYVRAGAEASMVGGLADWFAVTALFRHPLGLPIPHTAIIPRKKDQIGAALANFVQQNFLSVEVVSERLAQLRLPLRAGEWLTDAVHARQVADELGAALAGAVGLLRDEDLRTAVTSAVDRRLHEWHVAPVLSRVIDAVAESGQHQVALTAGLKGLMRFLDDNQDVFRQRLQQESPAWVPAWVDDRVFTRAFLGVQSFLADVAGQGEHELRRQFDARLRDYAEQLRTDPLAAAKVEAFKVQLLERPDVRDWISGLWTPVRDALLASSADPASDIHRAVVTLTMRLGAALVTDDEVRGKADSLLDRVVEHLLTRYSADVAGLISSTVERWDAADTGRRIEIQVGRDLQWIRVNGTVVGAIVGLVIYAVSQLL